MAKATRIAARQAKALEDTSTQMARIESKLDDVLAQLAGMKAPAVVAEKPKAEKPKAEG